MCRKVWSPLSLGGELCGYVQFIHHYCILKCPKALARRSRKYTQVENLGLLVTPFGQALRALALTCDDLRSLWSRSNLHASQGKLFTVWPPNPSQRKFSDVRKCIISQWNTGYVRCLEMVFFATRVFLWGNLPVRLATQRKSLRKFNLLLLAADHLPVHLTRAWNKEEVSTKPFVCINGETEN